MISAVNLPELGENVDEADVLTVLVSVGDSLKQDQPILEVETEKASVEVPTPIAGVVKAIHVKPGDAVHVGQILVELDTAATNAPEQAAQGQPAIDQTVAPGEGDGAEARPPDRRVHDVGETPTPASPPVRRETEAPVPAAPSVRRLARELGININEVIGRGPGGRIAAADVTRHARMLIQERLAATPGTPAASGHALELPDFARYGPVEREPMSGVRRKTARNMTRSWATIPHVTQFDRADITEIERARKHLAPRAEAAGSRLTLTAVVIKTVAAAVTNFPKFNASIDVEREEIIYKKYINIGVAVDTDRGLLVPVVRDADKKNLITIGRELAELSERAHARKSRPEDLHGANLTVTNLGGLGTTYFSPLINWPEVAVLGVGRASLEAVYLDAAFTPRLILPLSVSYDHRLIDGADAARFLRWIAEALEHPLALVLTG